MDIIILLIGFFLLFKGKLAWVLFTIIFLTSSYLGLGTDISIFPIEHNVSDAGLILYLALCFYILNKSKFKLGKTIMSKYLIILYIFLVITFIIDLLFNNIGFISIIKTSRHWIFLSCIWFFYYIPYKEIRKLIDYLFTSTVIISLIMLVEFFFETQILGKEYETLVSESGNFLTRGSIPSTFVPFFLLFLFTPFYTFKLKTKNFYIVLFSAVLITSVIRSWYLAMIVGFIILLFLQNKLKVKTIFTGILIMSGLIVAVSFNPIIKERFKEGFEEVQNFNFSTEKDLQGNYSFRMLHAEERINYILQNVQYTFFGLGNVTEENFPEVFAIGLVADTGGVIQLDTADIAWSTLFIRLGLLGTSLYLLFFVSILVFFYRNRKNNPLATVTFVYLFINLTILSFASSTMATGQFFIFPVLLYFLSKRKLVKVKYINN